VENAFRFGIFFGFFCDSKFKKSAVFPLAEIDKYIKALDDSDVDNNEEASKQVNIKLKVKNRGNK
jgi:hypothetical protein